jgi:hypothetical protein
MRHVVLLLPSSALAEALHEQNGLQDPQLGFGGEPRIGKDLRPKYIVDAYLGCVRGFHMRIVCGTHGKLVSIFLSVRGS